ncbi:hypothetical protein EDD15DRAFT_455140 [Pisolithus albus]|nr:hypothetical protein EDD15DRAFT_455140 [Pisolithus albus]
MTNSGRLHHNVEIRKKENTCRAHSPDNAEMFHLPTSLFREEPSSRACKKDLRRSLSLPQMATRLQARTEAQAFPLSELWRVAFYLVSLWVYPLLSRMGWSCSDGLGTIGCQLLESKYGCILTPSKKYAVHTQRVAGHINGVLDTTSDASLINARPAQDGGSPGNCIRAHEKLSSLGSLNISPTSKIPLCHLF